MNMENLSETFLVYFSPHTNIDYHPWHIIANLMIYEDKSIIELM